MHCYITHRQNLNKLRKLLDVELRIAYIGGILMSFGISIFAFLALNRIDTPDGLSWGITLVSISGLGLGFYGLVRAEKLERIIAAAEAEARMAITQTRGER